MFSECQLRCQSVLLLSDTNTAVVQKLVTSLQTAGLTVDYVSGGITNYDGAPAATSYGSIVLITGNSHEINMPSSGQTAILNAQRNSGTGVVMTEWAANHVLHSRWSILSPLLLAPRNGGETKIMSHTLISRGHSIWKGLPTSFNTTVKIGYSKLGASINATVVAHSSSANTPAVIVRPSYGNAGRIVQLAHAGHYSGFNYENDINLVTMMINAIKWASKII